MISELSLLYIKYKSNLCSHLKPVLKSNQIQQQLPQKLL